MRQARTGKPLDAESTAVRKGGDPRWIVHRVPATPEERTLSSSAMAWLSSLPGTLYPTHLVERYPRVCNCMAVLWQEPRLMISYFEDLLIDHRGMRQGFPSTIAGEIARLKEHFHLNLGPARPAICGAA